MCDHFIDDQPAIVNFVKRQELVIIEVIHRTLTLAIAVNTNSSVMLWQQATDMPFIKPMILLQLRPTGAFLKMIGRKITMKKRLVVAHPLLFLLELIDLYRIE